MEIANQGMQGGTATNCTLKKKKVYYIYQQIPPTTIKELRKLQVIQTYIQSFIREN